MYAIIITLILFCSGAHAHEYSALFEGRPLWDSPHTASTFTSLPTQSTNFDWYRPKSTLLTPTTTKISFELLEANTPSSYSVHLVYYDPEGTKRWDKIEVQPEKQGAHTITLVGNKVACHQETHEYFSLELPFEVAQLIGFAVTRPQESPCKVRNMRVRTSGAPPGETQLQLAIQHCYNIIPLLSQSERSTLSLSQMHAALGTSQLTALPPSFVEEQLSRFLSDLQSYINPIELEAFALSVEEYKQQIPFFSKHFLRALSLEQLTKILPLSRVPEEKQASARALLQDILALARHQYSSPLYWESHEEAYTSKNRDFYYTFTPRELAPLNRKSFFSELTSHYPEPDTSIPVDWLLREHYGEDYWLEYRYDSTLAAVTLSAPDQEEQQIQWEYLAAEKAWHHKTTHERWTHDSATCTWSFSLALEGHTPTLWNCDAQTATWSNSMTGEVWHAQDQYLWVKMSGDSDCLEKWLLEPFDDDFLFILVPPLESPDAPPISSLNIFRSIGPGVWEQQNETALTTWSWRPATESEGGIWIAKNADVVRMYTYNKNHDSWEHNGEKGTPPPQFPPFVVTVHNDLITAYDSLKTQRIIA